MHNTRQLLLTIAGFCAALTASQAAPLNKCVVDGTVTYQQAPCPSGQPRKQPTLAELNAAEKQRRAAAASAPAATPRAAAQAPVVAPIGSRCDGRRHCSQMRSCEEARYFLANCPGVMMDGDGDGVPCEEQWCGH
jgi:hypothetical protein